MLAHTIDKKNTILLHIVAGLNVSSHYDRYNAMLPHIDKIKCNDTSHRDKINAMQILIAKR